MKDALRLCDESGVVIEQVYHGEAINPMNLSFYERWTGIGKVCGLELLAYTSTRTYLVA